jgi:hypothetical protein
MDEHTRSTIGGENRDCLTGTGDGIGERYFRATALAGDLHFIDLRDWDSWEPSRMDYRDEAEVRWLVRAATGDRRIVRTLTELGAAVQDSEPSRTVYLYIHETLLQDAVVRWEEAKRNRNRHRALLRGNRPAYAVVESPPVNW